MAQHCHSVLSTLLSSLQPSTMERNRDRGETGSPPNWWTPRPDAEANRTRSYNSSVVPQDGPRPPKRSRPGPQSDFHAPPSKRTSPPHPASSNTDFSYIPNTNTTALPKPGLAYNEVLIPIVHLIALREFTSQKIGDKTILEARPPQGETEQTSLIRRCRSIIIPTLSNWILILVNRHKESQIIRFLCRTRSSTTCRSLPHFRIDAATDRLPIGI